MTLASRRLALAVAAVVIWAAITLVVPTIMLDSRTSLRALITRDLAWGMAGAAVFLVGSGGDQSAALPPDLWQTQLASGLILTGPLFLYGRRPVRRRRCSSVRDRATL